MKSLSIGRDQECDIILSDNSDLISRRHAVLNIYPSGKMTIIDYGKNGTYVNGVRITSEIPVPVTRKDIISFAHTRQLDWEKVPKLNTRMKYFLFVLVAVVFATGAYFSIDYIKKTTDQPISNINVVAADSIKIESAKNDTLKSDTAKVDIKKIPVKTEPKKPNDNKSDKKQKTKESEKQKDEKSKDSKVENTKKLPTF